MDTSAATEESAEWDFSKSVCPTASGTTIIKMTSIANLLIVFLFNWITVYSVMPGKILSVEAILAVKLPTWKHNCQLGNKIFRIISDSEINNTNN